MSSPVENTSHPDLTGRRLADYQLLRRLGRGAMAEVYLAEQTSLRRQVAFKVLHRNLAGDSIYVRRFHNEARAAASLSHANIVQIYEVGQCDGIHFIAQEYVAGRNLGELITRTGPPDLRLAVTVIRQTASALHRAAEQGIIHRDIKPENIMLARSGEVKVADFGLARIQGGDGVNLTQVGVTMGTPLYMSPEQIEGKPLDPRSDIYSLGVTCYHMLAGRPPFEGETALAVAIQHLNTSPKPLADWRHDLPAGLCRLVHKMLAKKPSERYQSARELLQQLRQLEIAGKSDWPEPLEDWTSAELIATSQARIDATQNLSELMKTEALLSTVRARKRVWLAGIVVAFVLGLWSTIWFRPEPLLAEAQRTRIPRRDSAWQQLYHAKQVDNEAAWRSVWEYFPQNSYATLLAKQNLIRYYLWSSGEYHKATPLLEELTLLPASEQAFLAFGIAGNCIVSILQDDQQQAVAEFARLTPEMLDDLDPMMRRTLSDAMSRARAELGRDAAQKLRQLDASLAEESPDDEVN